MQHQKQTTPREFMGTRISSDQAVRTLKKHGINVTNEEAIIILDFLYLLAKTTARDEVLEVNVIEPLVEIELR